MDGDVRSSSDEISDSSVDNPNKGEINGAHQQNGTPKKKGVKENGHTIKTVLQTTPVKNH